MPGDGAQPGDPPFDVWLMEHKGIDRGAMLCFKASRAFLKQKDALTDAFLEHMDGDGDKESRVRKAGGEEERESGGKGKDGGKGGKGDGKGKAGRKGKGDGKRSSQGKGEGQRSSQGWARAPLRDDDGAPPTVESVRAMLAERGRLRASRPPDYAAADTLRDQVGNGQHGLLGKGVRLRDYDETFVLPGEDEAHPYTDGGRGGEGWGTGNLIAEADFWALAESDVRELLPQMGLRKALLRAISRGRA
eukprot:gene26122-51072_t